MPQDKENHSEMLDLAQLQFQKFPYCSPISWALISILFFYIIDKIFKARTHEEPVDHSSYASRRFLFIGSILCLLNRLSSVSPQHRGLEAAILG